MGANRQVRFNDGTKKIETYLYTFHRDNHILVGLVAAPRLSSRFDRKVEAPETIYFNVF